MASEKVIHVTDNDFEEKVLKSNKPVLVDFWASWCGPCMMQIPILEQLAEKTDKVIVAKLSTEENSEMPMKYGVQAIPTLILFKNGQPAERMVGVQNLDKLSKICGA
jgi:thioredoxin 1